MVEMVQVARDEDWERHRGLPADCTFVGPCGLRNVPDDVQQVAVEQQPKVDDVGPSLRAVALDRNPGFLPVSRKINARFDQGAHNALMVVGGGIDEVAEDLLLRPTARPRLPRRLRVRDLSQALRNGLEDGGKTVGLVLHLRITLATPVLLAESAARITMRCSPGAKPVRSSANFSRMESITPSAASTGTQPAA